jgi:uncharacterized protein YdhG (YjbR/CyaY superfamily)
MHSSAKDIDTYIELQPENVKAILKELRQTIKKAVPEAEEIISYQMPAFRFHGILVWFAAFKNHYSIFIRPHILSSFNEELKPYELSKSKSAIKIPLDKPVPENLLTKIVKSAAKTNLENAQLKTKGKKIII